MTSLILSVAALYMLPLLLGFSVFLLVRGHDAPGGGFAAGLVAAIALALYLVAYGPARTQRLLLVRPNTAIAVGLGTAISSGLIGLMMGEPFLTGEWLALPLPLVGTIHIGTPLLFDVGVYLLVIGVVIRILFAVSEA